MDKVELDISHLAIFYRCNVRLLLRDLANGGDIEVSQSETIDLHIAAYLPHYGQERIFEV